MAKKVFYGRCSKDEAAQKNSIATQKKLVEDKISGLCDEYFVDIGKSGAAGLDKREGLAEAIETLHRGDELWVAKLDRLARDTYLNAYITLQVEKKGGKVISATEEGLNGDDDMAIFMKTIISAFATFERATIASRTRSTLRMKAARGERVSRFARYGTDIDTGDAKRVVSNPEEEKVLGLVKEMKEEGRSVADIHRHLNASGIPTKRGNDTWHYGQVYKLTRRLG
jgi:DNA invertase Pin-like site-specific DNA recombinase